MAHSVVSTALTMNVADLVKGVNTATTSLKSLEKNTTSVGNKIAKSLNAIKGAANLQSLMNYGRIARAAYQTATKATYGFVTSQIKLVKQQFDTAYSLGLTFNQLQAIGLAAEQAGLGVDRLYEPLSKIGKKIDDALQGSAESLRAFERLGLDPNKLAGIGTYEQFKQVGAALNAIPDAGERAALSMRLLEESGAKFLQLFAGGANGLDAFEKEAVKLGLTLNKIDLGLVLQANEALVKMKSAWAGVQRIIAVNVAPLVTGIADTMTAVFANEAFANKLKEIFASTVTGLTGVMASVIDASASIIALIESVFGKLEILIDNVLSKLEAGSDLKAWWDKTNASIEKGLWGRAADPKVIARGMAAEQWLARPLAERGNAASPIGDQLRKIVDDFNAGVTKPLSDNLKRVLEENKKAGVKPVDPGNAGEKAAAAIADKVSEAMQRVEKSGAASIASADDVRTGGGMAAWLKAMTPGYGESKEVQILEGIRQGVDRLAKVKPVPVNV